MVLLLQQAEHDQQESESDQDPPRTSGRPRLDGPALGDEPEGGEEREGRDRQVDENIGFVGTYLVDAGLEANYVGRRPLDYTAAFPPVQSLTRSRTMPSSC